MEGLWISIPHASIGSIPQPWVNITKRMLITHMFSILSERYIFCFTNVKTQHLDRPHRVGEGYLTERKICGCGVCPSPGISNICEVENVPLIQDEDLAM